MRDLQIGRNKIKLYDSIDELPLENWHKINKYMLIEAGVGSTLLDFDERIKGSVMHLKSGNTAKALNELNNMRQLFWFMTKEMNVSHLAFACLVHSINGEKIQDLSDEGLKNVLRQIDTQGSDGEPDRGQGEHPGGPKKILLKGLFNRLGLGSGHKKVRPGSAG